MKANKGKGNHVASKGSAPAADIPGVQVLKQAKSKAGGIGFKKGGAVKKKAGGLVPVKKEGGAVEGNAPVARLDKAPRRAEGGAINNRGRSPFSAAANIKTG